MLCIYFTERCWIDLICLVVSGNILEEKVMWVYQKSWGVLNDVAGRVVYSWWRDTVYVHAVRVSWFINLLYFITYLLQVIVSMLSCTFLRRYSRCLCGRKWKKRKRSAVNRGGYVVITLFGIINWSSGSLFNIYDVTILACIYFTCWHRRVCRGSHRVSISLPRAVLIAAIAP